MTPIVLISYIMAQKLILFYLRFEPKVLRLKTVMMIMKIIQFSPKFCNFFLLIQICKFFLVDYTLIIVSFVCKLR